VYIDSDPKQPSRYAVFAGQSGLGMARDYYLLPGAKYDAFRTAYRNYIVKLLTLANQADPAGRRNESSRSKRPSQRRIGRRSGAVT
jgi:predicted metalloendopeptidase